MVTALCNVYIGTAEKLEIFYDTFPIVFPVSDNWLIYIRGQFNKEAVQFIKAKKNNASVCTFFESLNEGDWAASTSIMLKDAKYKSIYVFGEDHLLIKNIDAFKRAIKDMADNKIDYFSYSFFGQGMSANSMEILETHETNYFISFTLSPSTVPIIKKTFS